MSQSVIDLYDIHVNILFILSSCPIVTLTVYNTYTDVPCNGVVLQVIVLLVFFLNSSLILH